MARLTHPEAGTVVHVEGDLEDQYRSQGWEEDQEEKQPRKRAATKK